MAKQCFVFLNLIVELNVIIYIAHEAGLKGKTKNLFFGLVVGSVQLEKHKLN